MSENTKIEWCDHTFNPWIGCTKVSSGCANCYAETLMDKRLGRVNWGKGQPRSRTSPAEWKKPLKWNRAVALRRHQINAEGDGIDTLIPPRPRVFCSSLADWLDPEVPIEWLSDLLDLIRLTPNLDWLLLTKRPELWRQRMQEARHHLNGIRDSNPAFFWLFDWMAGKQPSNVWIGTSAEDQKSADERIPHLLDIPAKVRFLSCEPMLGPVNLAASYPEELCVCSECEHYGVGDFIRECCECEGRQSNPDNGDCLSCNRGTMQDICPVCDTNYFGGIYGHPRDYAEGYEVLPGIHWVIAGGESGQGCRPFNPSWARSLRDQCEAAGVAFFMKQIGGTRKPFPEIPADLMIREFPNRKGRVE